MSLQKFSRSFARFSPDFQAFARRSHRRFPRPRPLFGLFGTRLVLPRLTLALFAEQLRINGCSVSWITHLTLGLFAEQAPMDVPKDLGQRIVEAARLAVALHLQISTANFGPALFSIGGADRGGGAVMDDGPSEGLALASSAPWPATVPCAGELSGGFAFRSGGFAFRAESEAA
jgi:hypothetical protein